MRSSYHAHTPMSPPNQPGTPFLERPYDGCTIPPEVYAIGMGWDPQPEVERLLFLAREAGVEVHAALELGCGCGRLLAPLAGRVERVVGVELHRQMAEAARQALTAAGLAGRTRVETADMCEPALGEKFDLIFTSANTLRHVVDDAALARFWLGVAKHLRPGGIFVADVEIGFAHEQQAEGVPQHWTVARDPVQVDVDWTVIRAPRPARPFSRIRWSFRLRGGGESRIWFEEFELRVFEIEPLLDSALHGGGLTPVGVYENRDPYLLPCPPRALDGRYLVVLRAPRHAQLRDV